MTVAKDKKSMRAAFFIALVLLISSAPALAAKPELAGQTVPSDQNQDGKVDHWEIYNTKGVRILVASDTNADGKADSWKHPIRAMLILREKDRNHDGSVDERMVTDFIYDKTLKIHRHLPLWREIDEDHDGKIDVYRVRGEQNPVPDRRGEAMDLSPWSEAKEAAIAKAQEDAAAKKSMESDNVQQMNARQALGF